MKRRINMSLGRELIWEFGYDDDYQPTGRELRNKKTHRTKDGKVIKLKDMEDRHLYYLYLCIEEQKYLDEMILLLFEERINK